MEFYRECWIRYDHNGYRIFDAGYVIGEGKLYKTVGGAKRGIDAYLLKD